MSTEIAKNELSPSERFTSAVAKEYNNIVGSDIVMTNFQKKLCHNYFIKLDMSLKEAENKRLSKRDADPLEFSWKNVNMEKLALDVVSFSLIGLDPLQPNHINLIPYKNKRTNKFDVSFIMGYDGLELKARKYGIELPDDIIIELVYETDEFQILKKDVNNRIESYTLNRKQPFNKGAVIGGFYAFIYFNHPEKNKVKEFSRADIEKRKPKHASAEFWGGETKKYGTNETEVVEGWYEEMALKTIKRAAFNSITIDSQKIDEHFLSMLNAERAMDMDIQELKIDLEIESTANSKKFGFVEEAVIEEETQKAIDNVAPEKVEITTEQETEKVSVPKTKAKAQEVQEESPIEKARNENPI